MLKMLYDIISGDDYVVTCRSAYTGLQYAYAISGGKVGRARLASPSVPHEHGHAGVQRARAALRTDPISRAGGGCGARDAGLSSVWEVGYASAGERTLSGSTPALYSAAPLRSLRHSLAPATPRAARWLGESRERHIS